MSKGSSLSLAMEGHLIRAAARSSVWQIFCVIYAAVEVDCAAEAMEAAATSERGRKYCGNSHDMPHFQLGAQW